MIGRLITLPVTAAAAVVGALGDPAGRPDGNQHHLDLASPLAALGGGLIEPLRHEAAASEARWPRCASLLGDLGVLLPNGIFHAGHSQKTCSRVSSAPWSHPGVVQRLEVPGRSRAIRGLVSRPLLRMTRSIPSSRWRRRSQDDPQYPQ